MTEEAGDTFNFYLKFAKPLVLGLQDPSDRIIAAAWIQKLRNETIADENVRKDYLKLLLFALHRGKLCGPFTENPTGMETLDKFPEDFKVIDVAKEMLVQDENERRLRLKRGLGASGDNPPYSTECSADLLEYAAAQDIPKFGVHAYYAVSFEPISKWDNVEKAQYPRAIAEMMEKSATRTAVSAPTIEVTPPTPGPADKNLSIPKPPAPKLSPGVTPKTPKTKSPRPSPRPKTPVIPVSPIDDLPKSPIVIPRIEVTEPDSPGRTEQHFEARSPITWGSNLIDVNDPPERDYDFPEGDVDDFLFEEPPSDFSSVLSDFDSSGSPTRAPSPGRDMNASAASLPYATPPRAGGSPSAMSPASLPYRTPPRLPQSPTSPASLPYRTPPRHPESPTSPASLPYRTPPRMDASPFGPTRTPQRSPPRDDAVVIPAGSAASKDIIAEANLTLQTQSAEESDGAADISPSAFDHLYPGRRTDMPRTPPMFSKFKELREGPGRTASYEPQMFGLTGEESWQSGGAYQFEPPTGAGSPSKPKRMQYRPTHKPLEQVFPGMQQTDEWSQMFFDVQKMDLVDDDLDEAASAVEFDISSPPQVDYDSQMKDLLDLLQERKQESPIAAGIGTTTPKLSPIPRRTKPYGTEYPIFLEDMPTFTSPERTPPSAVARSPSRASPARSPSRPPTPGRPQSPVRDPNTDSFGLPSVRTHVSPLKQPTPKASKPLSPKVKTPSSTTSAQGSSKKVTKTSSEVQTTTESSSGQDTSTKDKEEVNVSKAEELQQKTDTQYAAIYEALIVDPEDQKPPPAKQPCANKSPPRTPGRRSPGASPTSPQRTPPTDLMGVSANINYHRGDHYMDQMEDFPEGLQSPIRGPTVLHGWQTPPHLKARKEKTPSPYRPIQPRNMNEMLNLESFPDDEFVEPPETPPSPPRPFSYEEYADPFQRSPEHLDAQFQEDSDDYMPGLSSMLEAHEYVPYKQQPVTNVQVGRRRIGVKKASKEQRRTGAISESPEYLMLPSPERVDRRLLDTSGMGRTPSPVVVPQDQNLMSFAEEYFVNEFDVNPQQKDMLKRVIRLIDDVEGEPLLKDPEMLYAEVEGELPQVQAGQDPLTISPPRDLDAMDEIDQLQASPLRLPAPEPELEYPSFDFQEPVEHFMPQQPQYQLPIQQTSPRHRFTEPSSSSQPTDADFQQFQQMTQQYSPITLEDSPIQLVKSPSPERRVRQSPESPPTPHYADFLLESLTREPEPYTDEPMILRRGDVANKWMKLRRHSGKHIERLGDIREVPPGYDEDLADFNYSMDRARETYPWAQFIKGPKMRKPNIMSPVDEAHEFVDSPVPPAGRPRITKRMVRKRLNFDSVDPDPSSPEPPKVVDMPLEPLPRMPDQPLPPPRETRRSPRVVYAVGSPIKLDENLNVVPRDLSSPTAMVEHLTRKHRDLLNEQLPLPMPDDLMGTSAPVPYASPAHLMDMGISDFLPSPQLKLPTQLEGWKTPPNLAASRAPQMSPQALPPLFTNFADELSSEMPPQEYDTLPTAQQEELLESPLTTGAPYFMESMEETQWPSVSPGYNMDEVEEPVWPSSPPSSPFGMQSPRPSPGIKKTTSKTIIKSPHMTKTTEIYKTEPDYSPDSSPGYFMESPDFRQQGQYDHLFNTPDKHQDPFQSPQPMTSAMAKILTRTMSPAPRDQRTPSPRQQTPPQAQYAAPRTPQRPPTPTSPFRTPPRSAWDEREATGLMDENPPEMASSPYIEENEVIEEVQEPDKTTKTTHITKKTGSPGGQGQHYDFLELVTETEGEPEKPNPYASLKSADDYNLSPKMEPSNVINANLPMMERVEHLIADIPGGTTPPRAASPYKPMEYTSPTWSPGLPIATGAAQLDAEYFPMEEFQSPQSPMARSPSARSPTSRSPARQSPRASPNILAMSPDTLGVAALGEEDFPEMMSPESPPRESPARFSPPRFSPDFTPPRPSPPRMSPPRSQRMQFSPEPAYPDPNEMKQEIESHQYTEQHYDRNRKLLRNVVRSGKKVVPLHKGAGRPKLGIIADMEEPVESPRSPEAYPMDAFDISPPSQPAPAVQWVSPPQRFERQGPAQAAPQNSYAFTPPKATFDQGMFGDETIFSSPPPDLYASPESMFSSQSEWYSAEDGNAIFDEQPEWAQSPEWEQSPDSPQMFDNAMMELDDEGILGGSPPMLFETPPSSSPAYSPFQQSVRDHQYTPGFHDPNRPGQRSSLIRTGNRMMNLQRHAAGPTVDTIVERPESPITRNGQYPLYATGTPPSAERNYRSPEIPEMIRFEPSPPRRSPVAPDYGSYAATPQHGNQQPGRARTQTKMRRRRLMFDEGPPDSPPTDAMYDTARAPSPPSYPRQPSPQQMQGNVCSAPGQSCYSPQRGTGAAAPQYVGGTPPSSRPPKMEEVIDETITYSPSGQPQSMTKKVTKESPNDSFMEYEYKVFDGDFDGGILDTSDIPDLAGDDDDFGWLN